MKDKKAADQITEDRITEEIFSKEWEKARAQASAFIENRPRILEGLNLTRSDVGPAYEQAYNAFAAEDYESAESLFTLLFLLDMKERAFQTGLAASFEAQEKFDPALALYALAMSQDSAEDPRLLFRAGKCLVAKAAGDEARILFEKAARCPAKDAKGLAAVERSKKMLAVLTPQGTKTLS